MSTSLQIDNEKRKMITYLIQHNLFKTILQGKIEGQRGRERTRRRTRSCVEQVKEKVRVQLYLEAKK